MKTIATLLVIFFSTILSAGAYTISGEAVNSETGDPLAGIELGLEVPGSYIFATTGDDGHFVFSGLSDGTFLLYYYHSDFIDGAWFLHQEYGQITISGGNVTDINFELDPHYPNYGITGNLYNALTGEPVTNLNYAFFLYWDDSWEYDFIIPNPDGTFAISGLPDWSYTIDWSGNNDYEGFVQPVTIEKNGANPVEVDIYLTPKSGPFISGKVLDFDTQEPVNIAGRTIRLSDLPMSHWTQTDENGEFMINGLEAGQFYYELEIRTQDTAYINGEGSHVYNLTVPEEGLSDVVIYQHKFESAHEVVASTEEFTAGETQTIDFSVLYDDAVFGEIWGVMLQLPEGVTAVNTPEFVSTNYGNTLFTRNYDCSTDSKLVWEGYHYSYFGGNIGNLEILGDEGASDLTLQFDESLAGESVEIYFEVYYALTCAIHYFSHGSIELTDDSGPVAMGSMQGFIRDATTNQSINNATVNVMNTSFAANVVTTPFGSHYNMELPEGNYTLMCEGVGYEPATLSDIDISNGQNMNYNFYLQPVQSPALDLPKADNKITGNQANTTFEDGNVNVLISPNPATTNVNIATDRNFRSVIISNLAGETVFNISDRSNQITLDVSELPQGLYVMHIQTDHGSTVEKLIIR